MLSNLARCTESYVRKLPGLYRAPRGVVKAKIANFLHGNVQRGDQAALSNHRCACYGAEYVAKLVLLLFTFSAIARDPTVPTGAPQLRSVKAAAFRSIDAPGKTINRIGFF